MNIADIHKSIAQTVKKTFGVPCFSRDTPEGGQKPCFFLEINPDSITRDTKYYDNYSIQIELTYSDTKRNEETFYNIIDKMKDTFLHYIYVNDRCLHVTYFDYNYVGDNDEQLAFQIETQFKCTTQKEITGEIMQELNLEIVERR